MLGKCFLKLHPEHYFAHNLDINFLYLLTLIHDIIHNKSFFRNVLNVFGLKDKAVFTNQKTRVKYLLFCQCGLSPRCFPGYQWQVHLASELCTVGP